MNKIKLDLERLSVTSFDTTPAEPQERGTVHGHYSQVGTCDLAGAGTCAYGGTCTNGCPRTRACTVEAF